MTHINAPYGLIAFHQGQKPPVKGKESYFPYRKIGARIMRKKTPNSKIFNLTGLYEKMNNDY